MASGSKYNDRPWGNGSPKWVRTTDTNDSDVTVTVPVGKFWILKYAYVELVATATVGTRLLRITIGNGTANIIQGNAISITASQVGNARFQTCGDIYEAQALVLLNGNAANGSISQTIPEFILPAGYTIQFHDEAAIDAAADDMIHVIHYVEYDA